MWLNSSFHKISKAYFLKDKNDLKKNPKIFFPFLSCLKFSRRKKIPIGFK